MSKENRGLLWRIQLSYQILDGVTPHPFVHFSTIRQCIVVVYVFFVLKEAELVERYQLEMEMIVK